MSYLGPDNMRLVEEAPERRSFTITGKNMPLAELQLALIDEGDRVQVTRPGSATHWGPVREVYDADGEGTVLWNEEGADETGAHTVDLYELLVRGRKVKVSPK